MPYEVIYHPFPINSQYLKMWGVDSPVTYHHVHQGGYPRFQVMEMIESGQKSKPKIIPKASKKTQINPWTKN